jgi:dTDP-glucose 4,6-dehydratase
MEIKRTLLVTGGAGFIGSNLLVKMVRKYPNYHFYNLDILTYAGNLENLKEIETEENYTFIKGDICDSNFTSQLFQQYKFDGVLHLAAESHVDRSIHSPMDFVMTNVVGTVNLLNGFKGLIKNNIIDKETALFYHISTDEVYGSLGETGFFLEDTPYDPHSPYSASKASSDHFVRAYSDTYDLPIVISNCSNNYGARQFPEKLIPLSINNIKENKPLPIYGKGDNIRDWLWVEDHCDAIDLIFHKGKLGDTYNIGGNNEWTNIDLVKALCTLMDEQLNRPKGTSEKLITFVTDRPGHDKRYAIDSSKLKNELGWEPTVTFEEGFKITAKWYLDNGDWLDAITSGNYQQYYSDHYGHPL